MSEWISVSSKMPKKMNEGNRKAYLVQDRYGNMYTARLNHLGWWVLYRHLAVLNDIVAWHELPAPYNVNKENS